MRTPDIARWLPEGYEFESGAGGVLALLHECAPALRAAGYGLSGDGALSQSHLSGRRPLHELPTAAGVFVVRRHTHGGLLRFLTRDRFGDPSRPFRELSVSASLVRAGLATPQVAAARARPAPGWGWRIEIVTRRVEGACDLDEVLALSRRGKVDARVLRPIARATGGLVRALHDAGCSHADLTTKNLLVERSALEAAGDHVPKMWVLDLDRAKLLTALSGRERRASLARLYRYVVRREHREGRALARTDWCRFLRGYELDRARRKAEARSILQAHARNLPWHALGWQLERVFAAK